METSQYNEYCQYMQYDPQRCKIKMGKFHFIILWRFGVIEERFQGGIHPPPPPGLERVKVTALVFLLPVVKS